MTLSLIKHRQQLFQWEIARLNEFLDGHIQEHITMKADSSCEEDVIQEHTKEGFMKELEYKARVQEMMLWKNSVCGFIIRR
ncbi:hypothetical protein PHMEG_00024373 [Phytophthora megakarya]|uniref:Uncharacterized protein n=1 Tax=Phytophthora megakarya TaxID=4795 RepID=A0A225VE87_9STRA|nr:hypothetical protein PHMEG_00024373 [Phytophthora megakarya]